MGSQSHMAIIVAPICPNTPALLHQVDLGCASRFISASSPTTREPLSPSAHLTTSSFSHSIVCQRLVRLGRTPSGMPSYFLQDCHYFYRTALRGLNISTRVSPLYA